MLERVSIGLEGELGQAVVAASARLVAEQGVDVTKESIVDAAYAIARVHTRPEDLKSGVRCIHESHSFPMDVVRREGDEVLLTSAATGQELRFPCSELCIARLAMVVIKSLRERIEGDQAERMFREAGFKVG
jgi:hypothetical protein